MYIKVDVLIVICVKSKLRNVSWRAVSILLATDYIGGSKTTPVCGKYKHIDAP